VMPAGSEPVSSCTGSDPGACVSDKACGNSAGSCVDVPGYCMSSTESPTCDTSQPTEAGVQPLITGATAAPAGSPAPNARTFPNPGRTGSLRIASFRTSDPDFYLSPGLIVRPVASPKVTAFPSSKVEVLIVANGNSSGEAFALQVFDPSGKTRTVAMPEGVVLEPVKRGSAKPSASQSGAAALSPKLVAYCVAFSKLPPEAGTLFRVGGPELQKQFQPARAVLRAGRELAATGKFHPDSEPTAYADSIRQYALWTRIENWNEQKFGEVFLEKTKANALAAKVKWTKQMEQAVSGLVPGRWSDISMVLDQASRLSSAPTGGFEAPRPPQ